MKFFAAAGLVVALDQLSKHLVTTHMHYGQSITLIENFLYITFIQNPGAAFGMLPYRTELFIAITFVVAGLIYYFQRTLPPGQKWMRLGLALQFGGAVGNLIDRIRDGYVIDFINFTVWPPVFNLADSAIVVGIFIFIIAFWRSPDSKPERS